MSDPEERAKAATAEKYWTRWKAATEACTETDTSVGRELLRSACKPLREALEAWMSKASTGPGRKHSALVVFQSIKDVDHLSVIVLREILNGLTSERPHTGLALAIGTAIETEGRLEDAHHKHPLLLANLQRAQFSHRGEARRHRWVLDGLAKVKAEVTPRLAHTLRLRAGVIALELVEASTGLVTTRQVRRGKKLVRMVEASEGACTWLSESHMAAQYLTPLFPLLPHPPVPWTGPSMGGYIDLPLSLVKKTNNKKYEGVDLTRIFAALNVHQDTPWAVHADVYLVMWETWNRGLELGNLPTPELLPYPPKPPNVDKDAGVRKRYGRERNRIRSLNSANKSKRIHTSRLLRLAAEHIQDPFYQPAGLDFRGRMYTIPAGLSSQGGDAARGLLKFERGLPLIKDGHDATDTFLAYGASLYGFKGTEREKALWATHHKEEILGISEEPFDYLMWCEASDPWQFLAWAFEVGQYWMLPKGAFFTHLPIGIDASANGCQIWALLLRDLQTAKATNVYPNEEAVDLYEDVATHIKDAFAGSSEPFARAWLASGLLSRKLTKAAVLIIPFSGTQIGMSNALHSKLQELKSSGFTKFSFANERKACYFLAGQILEATRALIPAVLEGMRWTRSVSNICAEHGVAFEWVTPTGFPVVNDYKKPKYKKVRTWLGTGYATNVLAESTPDLSKRRCGQTIMANFTHSLDGAIACKTINAARYAGVEDISVVFDQFATHAVQLETLRNALLFSVADMFGGEEDYLSKVRKHLLTLLPSNVTLPEPPVVGDFDVNLVTKSRHFAS